MNIYRGEMKIKIENTIEFIYQPSLFARFAGRSIDADLGRNATIPTTVFLSEITEIDRNVLSNSGTDTKRL